MNIMGHGPLFFDSYGFQDELWTTLRLIIVFAFILMFFKIKRGASAPRESKSEQVDETRMIQEMYQGLERMEERVENLETLLLDRESERKGG